MGSLLHITWGARILAHGWLSGYGQSYPIDTAWVTGCRRLLGSPPVHTVLGRLRRTPVLGRLRRTPNSPWFPGSPPAHTQLMQLFQYKDGRPLTKKTFVDEVRRLLESASTGNTSSYSGHSFQIGAATSAAMAGAPDWQINAMGRWKSDFVVRYIRHDSSAMKGLAKLLTSSFSDWPRHVRIVAYTLCQTNKLNSKLVTAEPPSWGGVTAAHYLGCSHSRSRLAVRLRAILSHRHSMGHGL